MVNMNMKFSEERIKPWSEDFDVLLKNYQL